MSTDRGMRVSELSAITGVPIPTIKYYVREGMLHRAAPAKAPAQVRYDETHAHRIRLIRVLLDVGGLSVSATREVLAAVDDPQRPTRHILGTLLYAAEPGDGGTSVVARGPAAALINDIIGVMEWVESDRSPAQRSAIDVVARMIDLGHLPSRTQLLSWAAAADQIARADIEAVDRSWDDVAIAEATTVRTVVGDALLAALRQMAQERYAAQQPSASDKGPDVPLAGIGQQSDRKNGAGRR
ncbi:MerR family transcriptional regulator [Pseudonocardia sp. EV170527-09]|uniref:MerR family transcriptional regulator n=1 Tax=Pseudonocardia sp. EV170527-09 TaxID=2603411 RepID=UPI0011F21762|nr:MerR family transcriptional regulator [Pseudonocardia sp. EV170527-09]KAA1018354.1 MerR family transcriptional regulator [Pseudonocardia sp. EV170527-09]